MDGDHVIFAGNSNSFNTFHDNTRFSYLNEIREQFAKFENEVWNYNSLRPSEAFKIDLKLPFVLIETFAKLFRLWKDFAAFQKLIEPEVFRQISNDMNAYFKEDNMSNFEVYCDTCDKQITIERNDLKYSYELHSQDSFHQQMLNNFNYLICSSEPDRVNSNQVVADDDSKDDFNGYIIITKDNRLKCTLCDKSLIDEQEAIHHVTSWPHRLKEMQFDPNDTNYVVEIDGIYCCRLCRCKLPDNKQYQQDHTSSNTHKLMEKCQRVLKENKTHVTLLNNDNGEFMCESCDVSGANWNTLLEHCQSRNHLMFQKTSGSTHVQAEDDDFISFTEGRYECVLCQCFMEKWQIEEHKKNKVHMDKYYMILNDDIPNTIKQLDSSTESEYYNDAFKNNDIYLEVKLIDDDSEVFKCILCNKSGKGVVELDAHCLTSIHQQQKKHIEEVSRMYANNDVDDENEETIKDMDDLYYCRACDILIDNEISVLDHIKTKKHSQLEQLHKVLNKNGICISLVAEEPTKLYHCQLCSKPIDGDNNVIGHSNSTRHKQLLNMIEALSRNR